MRMVVVLVETCWNRGSIFRGLGSLVALLGEDATLEYNVEKDGAIQ